MDSLLYREIADRAGGSCECGCETRIPPGELDHFFGRVKAEEGVATCWFLSVACHFAKTNNEPSSAAWCNRFYVHAMKHGYHEAAERAAMKVRWLKAKGL